MSEQIPVSRLDAWLKKAISSEISQTERERDKLLSEIARALDMLAGNCNQLYRKAEQDMETKRSNRAEYRAARAVVRLTGIISSMCKLVTIGSSKDSVSLRNLQRETSKLASDAARSREEWLRQIRPYYIIDMMTLGGNIDKARRLGDELHSFLVGRGSLLRSLEELNEKLNSLNELRTLRESKVSQRQALESRIKEGVQTEAELRTEIENLRNNPKMKKYLQIDAELTVLRRELLRTGFSRLGRPLKRLISISERGDYPLPVEVRESLKEYVRKPFTTFLKEEPGYPRLKAVMSALSQAVSSGKLALKQREAKKVAERASQVVAAESLSQIHAKARALKEAYDGLLLDQETSGLVSRLKDLRQRGRTNHALQQQIHVELKRAIENEKQLDGQIGLLLKEIEAFVRKLSKPTIKLQLA